MMEKVINSSWRVNFDDFIMEGSWGRWAGDGGARGEVKCGGRGALWVDWGWEVDGEIKCIDCIGHYIKLN